MSRVVLVVSVWGAVVGLGGCATANQAPRVVVVDSLPKSSAPEPTASGPTASDVQYLEQACESGTATACHLLGDMYERGKGVVKDSARAIQLFTKACEGGDVRNGCASLGYQYQWGWGVPKDERRAAPLLKQACDADNALACGSLGLLYARGRGVTEDQNRAAQLFEKSCRGGDAMGCHFLGHAAWKGLGIAKDEPRALTLFEKSCAGGFALSCTFMGEAYRDGRGLPKDGARAAVWFSKACKAGKELAKGLHEELTRKGLPVALFISSDPSQSATEILQSQLKQHRYEEVITVGTQFDQDAEGKALYLFVESSKLVPSRTENGEPGVVIRKGPNKRALIIRGGDEDFRVIAMTHLANEFVSAFRP